jgi:nickel-dependent lactate racemase
MQEVTLPNMLWFGNVPRVIGFPDRWKVDLLEPPGFSKPALSHSAMEEAIARPIGSPTIHELAAEAHEVAIVFDDMTRPTPVADVLPFVLGPLTEAGVPDENIRFIPALGMHGAMTNMDLRKKLGDEVVRKYAVFNHNPYENCEYLGETGSGLPVYLNREFLTCDLRIGIGCITPHVRVGFGGGGKILLPGIAGVDTIKTWHKEVMMRAPATTGLGKFENNVMHREVVDVTRLSGLNLKVDALVNDRGQITDLFVGDPLEEHKVGVEEARRHYATRQSVGSDIMVVNAYGKYSEMFICLIMALGAREFKKGTIVIVADAPDGQICHYLMRSFGKEYGGECYRPRGPLPDSLKVIIMTEYPDKTMTDWVAPAHAVTVTGDWEETLTLLEADYPGEASVAVIPDGTMQYFR